MENFKNSTQRDFEEEIFEKLSFDRTQLLNYTFEDCRFVDCHFNNVNFFASKLQNVSFENCKFTGIDFYVLSKFLIEMHFDNSVLEICTFRDQKLQDLSFNNCGIKECEFDRCDLQKVSFKNCDLQGTSFNNCNLMKADFKTAKNYFFDLNENKVKGAKFSQPEVLRFLTPFGIKVD